jgi:hypothetical protein
MQDAFTIDRIRRKFGVLEPLMDERMRRQWAATEAAELGWGGVSAAALATGLSRTTITAGLRERRGRAEQAHAPLPARVRRPGGGGKCLTATDPGLLPALAALVDPVTRGDPASPLRWTCKSPRRLAGELTRPGHPIGPRCVAALLKGAGYSLQANHKARAGRGHPDRNAPFEYSNAQVTALQRRGPPVVSVDTKKKELGGDFKNGGRAWPPLSVPAEVRVHDFPDKELGKAILYGVSDITNNQGWVSGGIDHDTAHFAARSIWRWWEERGATRFPRARELALTAAGGGSNSCRSRLGKVALQGLADATGLRLRVLHFPPGTSTWNKVAHRLFCHSTQNWRGQPLVSREAIVSLSGGTTTSTGLTVRVALDTERYETGIKVSDAELAAVQLMPDEFHGDWNYSIKPRKQSKP